MTTNTIEIDATKASIADADDCLAAAAEQYVAEHPDAAGWDLGARWADDSRTVILLDVPLLTVETETRHAIDIVRDCRGLSERAWEAAADGAEVDGHDRAPVEAAAEECDEHYAAAIEALRAGNRDGAIAALRWAGDLERQWGDDSAARAALAAVRA